MPYFIQSLKFITFIVASLMCLPVIEAQPAELEITPFVFAYHMVTPLILLNRHTTSRTRFSIYIDPFRILAFLSILALPVLGKFTVDGMVVFKSASKAKNGETFALNSSRCQAWIFYAVDAVRGWTPPDSFILLYVRVTELFDISSLVLLLQILPIEGIEHD